MTISLASRARRRVAVLAAVAVAALFGYAVGREARVGWLMAHPTDANLLRVLALAPGHCEAFYRLGMNDSFDLSAQNLAQGEAYLRRAVECRPSSSRYIFGLATALEAEGKSDAAIETARNAVAVDPHNVHQLWQSGSLLLRNGRAAEAFSYFHQVLDGAPEYAPQVFSACWKSAGDGGLILSRVVPDVTELNLAYLQFLVASTPAHLEEAHPVWNRLLERRAKFAPESVFPYLEALVDAGQSQEASTDWDELVRIGVLTAAEAHAGGNLIVNGGFEAAPLNGGLDWRIAPVPGVSVNLDSTVRHSGERSLALHFEGLTNLDFAGAYEEVPVEPHTRYRFAADLKSQNVSTTSGPHFEIFDPHDPAHPLLETTGILGTTNWTEYASEFETGPGTRVIVVRVRRAPAVALDGLGNRIAGTLWIDDVRLSASPNHIAEGAR